MLSEFDSFRIHEAPPQTPAPIQTQTQTLNQVQTHAKRECLDEASIGDLKKKGYMPTYGYHMGMGPHPPASVGFPANGGYGHFLPEAAHAGHYSMPQFHPHPHPHPHAHAHALTHPQSQTQYMMGVASGLSQYSAYPGSHPQFAPQMQSPYSTPGPINPSARTVYLGNLPADVSLEELLDTVKGGMIEYSKVLNEKNCAFITFVEAGAAASFYVESTQKGLSIRDQEVKVGWGKPSQIPPNVAVAVQNGVSRNIFVGNIDESIDERVLRDEFSKYGTIDTIKILRDKRIGFVHMSSIPTAMKAVASLPNDSQWLSRRVNYGKDRCAHIPKPALTNLYANFSGPNVSYYDGYSTPSHAFNPYTPSNRTVYLGGIYPDVSTKEICDIIRGGVLQHIKYMADKNIAFVTFVNPSAALSFYNRSNYEGLVLKGKRLKVGWGKAAPLSTAVAAAVQTGASRNVYVGHLDESMTEDELRENFMEFGDIELVNLIPEKKIGFVNFTDIMAAVKAVDTMRHNPTYAHYKVNFGKDRCGNAPRHSRDWQGGSGSASNSGGGSGMVMGGLVGDVGGYNTSPASSSYSSSKPHGGSSSSSPDNAVVASSGLAG